MIKRAIEVTEATADEELKVLRELNDGTTPQSVFDDIAELQTQMEDVLTELANLGLNYLPRTCASINGEDLNEQKGTLIIAYGNNCTNRPSGLNGYLINIPHDTMPDRYNKQFWFTRPTNNIYTRCMENGVWEAWTPLRYDTGWVDIPLAEGITVANEARPVQYRRINNEVFLRGGIRGVTADLQVIGTLPNGYRPPNGFYAVQVMQHTAGEEKSTGNFWRMNIRTNGEIVMQYNTNPTHSASHWYDIDTQFLMN